MKTIKSTIILSLLLSSICLINCGKEAIIESEAITPKIESPLTYTPCGISNDRRQIIFNKIIENYDTVIEKSDFVNNSFFFKTNTSSRLSPCNLPEEYKIEGLKVNVRFILYSVVCPQNVACNDSYYPQPSELISIRKR